MLLTNKSLSFSAHQFNVGKQELVIKLKDIKDVYVQSNMLISQTIKVETNEKSYRLVVYHGKEWVAKIKEAIEESNKNGNDTSNSDMEEELIKIKKLLDAGLITEEDYAIKKRQILNI